MHVVLTSFFFFLGVRAYARERAYVYNLRDGRSEPAVLLDRALAGKKKKGESRERRNARSAGRRWWPLGSAILASV